MQTDFVIVGNALSAMIAAKEVADHGAKVSLVNGSQNWGGHFSVVKVGDYEFDAGMVMHEFTSFNSNTDADISSYDATIRNDAGRFCNTVRTFVDQYQQTHDVQNIKMLLDGQIYDDLLIANNLKILPTLPFSASVESEVNRILATNENAELHAKNKLLNSNFALNDFETVSLANHGITFHTKVIEPFCKKLLNVSTKSVSAYYHRVPWLPLFYPETLLSFLKGQPQSLPKTIFSYPTGEHVGNLSRALHAQLVSHPNISIVDKHLTSIAKAKDTGFRLSFEQHEEIMTSNLAWSNSLSLLLKQFNVSYEEPSTEKASFVLLFALIPESSLKTDISVLSVVDPDFLAYRITDQTNCANIKANEHKLVIEINADVMHDKQITLGEELYEHINKELIEMGVIAPNSKLEILKSVCLNKALALPTLSNIREFDMQFDRVKSMLGEVALLGPASGFSSSSFNHQVLQGLQLAQQWGNH